MVSLLIGGIASHDLSCIINSQPKGVHRSRNVERQVLAILVRKTAWHAASQHIPAHDNPAVIDAERLCRRSSRKADGLKTSSTICECSAVRGSRNLTEIVDAVRRCLGVAARRTDRLVVPSNHLKAK